MLLQFERRKSPIGTMLVIFDASGRLRSLDFADYESRMHLLLRRHYGDYELRPDTAPRAIADPLDGYFTGAIDALDVVEVATGGTAFQRQVWRALRTIGPGMTTSYGQLAAQIGHGKASRAVGLANGANPIAIVVPCHRVIGANGKLTGYGGGLPRKQWLIDHERRHAHQKLAG